MLFYSPFYLQQAVIYKVADLRKNEAKKNHPGISSRVVTPHTSYESVFTFPEFVVCTDLAVWTLDL